MNVMALFIIDKAWKQPRCPSVGVWINKVWYIHTMEYYSADKRNELLMHDKTQSNLENIMLSEKSQSQRPPYSMTLFILKVQNRQIHRDIK